MVYNIALERSLTLSKLGIPTILINNAAIVTGKSMLESKPEDVERTFRVNLLSHFHTIKTFLPGMLEEERGTIVTIASVLGHLGCANLGMRMTLPPHDSY